MSYDDYDNMFQDHLRDLLKKYKEQENMKQLKVKEVVEEKKVDRVGMVTNTNEEKAGLHQYLTAEPIFGAGQEQYQWLNQPGYFAATVDPGDGMNPFKVKAKRAYIPQPMMQEDADFEMPEEQNYENERGNYIKYCRDLFVIYKNSGDKMDLLKFLLVNRNISSGSSCVNLDIRNVPDDKINRHIKERITRDWQQIEFEMMEHLDLRLDPDTKADLLHILDSLYRGGAKSKPHSLYLNYKEVYIDLINECVKKNIPLTDEIKKISKMNFKGLRAGNKYLEVQYLPLFNLLIKHDIKTRPFDIGTPNTKFFKCLHALPTIETVSAKADEVITLNGEEYSKKIFESLIECSLEDFIDNLNIEKIIEEKTDVLKEEQLNLM